MLHGWGWYVWYVWYVCLRVVPESGTYMWYVCGTCVVGMCVLSGCPEYHQLWADASASVWTLLGQSLADVACCIPCRLWSRRGPAQVWSWPAHLQRHEQGVSCSAITVSVCLSVCLLARLQTWMALIFSRFCLSVCLSLTGTSTHQRRPILTKLGHKDPTLI